MGREVPFHTANEGMKRVLALADRVAAGRSTVLLVGESGTGKGLLARRIHESGPRRDAPFVPIACANLPDELMESELFGHEAGAFTDAKGRRVGRFEAGQGGTVFLDGAGDLSPAIQAKLLRVVQERSFERLGGNETITLDVRLLAATDRPLEERVAEGSFREDLFYRLQVVELRLPPLRERPEDVPLLARLFLVEARRAGLTPATAFSSEALERLRAHRWPGNVRQLRNAVEAAALRSEGAAVEAEALPLDGALSAGDFVQHGSARDLSLAELEAMYIREVLRRTRGHKGRAAEILGINRKTLLEKRRRYGIS
jgi:two-component system response regulator HydG